MAHLLIPMYCENLPAFLNDLMASKPAMLLLE
jgi:hypothetical protein